MLNGRDGYVLNHRRMDLTPEGIVEERVLTELSWILNTPDTDGDNYVKRIADASGGGGYGSRALPVSRPNGVVQISEHLQGELFYALEHYNRVGLPVAGQIVQDDSFGMTRDLLSMQKTEGFRPSFYLYDDKYAYGAYPHKKWRAGSRVANSKNALIKLAQELGVCTPKTVCYEDKDEVRDEDLDGLEYPVYLKADSNTREGLGVKKCEDEAELRAVIALIPEGAAFQIQAEVKADTFINVQYWIDEHAAEQGVINPEQILVTDQVLEGNSHIGNQYPFAYHYPWSITDPLALELGRLGLRGVFAFDIAVTISGCAQKYVLLECNGRPNGASYPTVVMRKLEEQGHQVPFWTSVVLPTQHKSLGDLDLGELEYSQETEKGIILINWGMMDKRKVGVMVIGNPDEQETMRRTLEKRL